MVPEQMDRTQIIQGGFYSGDLVRDRVSERPRSQRYPYCDVAFVAGGKGKHRMVAQERAVWLIEKSAMNLTPLDRATQNVWRGRYIL